MAEIMMEIRGLTKRYGDHTVLENIDLDVKKDALFL